MLDDRRKIAETMGASGIIARAENDAGASAIPINSPAAAAGAKTASRADWAQVWLTALLVAITGVYTVVAGCQTHATQVAADAAKSAAKTAYDQLGQMKRDSASSARDFQTQLQRSDDHFHTQLQRSDHQFALQINKSVQVASEAAKAANRQAVASEGALKQARLTVQAATRQASASDRIAKASEKTLAATRANFELDERPYIGVVVRSIVEDPNVPGATAAEGLTSITATTVITNFGRTPALHVSLHMLIEGSPYEDAEIDYLITHHTGDVHAAKSTVSPTSFQGEAGRDTASITQPVTPGMLKSMFGTDAGTTVGGYVEYEDYAHHRHQTDFCVKRMAKGNLVFCLKHNSMVS